MTTITICGSMRFAKEMGEWKNILEERGFRVFVPSSLSQSKPYKESGSHKEAVRRKIENDYINNHHEFIKKSDGVLVINNEKNGIANYVGGNTLMEIGFAFTLNRDIFLLNPVPELSYKSEIEAMAPILIDNDARKISSYYKALPAVYLSSESILKLTATSLGFRELGIRCNVLGKKTTSNVSEQPFTIEETYMGAENRLADLKKLICDEPYQYLVSIESGIARLHKKHNVHGFSVCIIEDKTGKRSVSISTELEIPKEMTDLVPEPYADLGVLVQQKHGLENKDPYNFLTNGKITRDKLMINAVVNALAGL